LGTLVSSTNKTDHHDQARSYAEARKHMLPHHFDQQQQQKKTKNERERERERMTTENK